MDKNRILVRRGDVLEAEVDGDRVLMSGSDFKYFGLVGTGALVWDRIDGTVTLGAIIKNLAEEFSVDANQVDNDVVEFVSALDSAGLIER